jgi:8-hydroxy-5-deazaflavin:NADPH oxidoreductase
VSWDVDGGFSVGPDSNGEDQRMNYGFIGAGAIAQALVRRLTAVGESDIVLSNSREPKTLALLAQQIEVQAGTRADAAAAEVVVLAVPWSRIPAALNGLDLNGRVLIDTTNPLEAPTFQPFDLGGLTSSESRRQPCTRGHGGEGVQHSQP